MGLSIDCKFYGNCPFQVETDFKGSRMCTCTPEEHTKMHLTDKKDSINPSHYKSHASGIECIQITEYMSFTLGNAIKYIWRADLKHDDGGIEDLKKALWYLNRELDKRQSQSEKQESSA